MKKYICTSICLGIAFLFCVNTSKAQTPQQNLDKYWHYRNRLIQSFTTIGMGQGKSLPAARRNGANGASPNGTDDTGLPNNEMYWGDDGRTMGYYIGTLATEYALLKSNGQNTNETVMELFYALHTLFRLDSTAVNLWSLYDQPFRTDVFPATANVIFPGYGYMISDDVPASYLPTDAATPLPGNLNNEWSQNGKIVSLYGSGQVGPVTNIVSDYYGLMNKLSSATNASVHINANHISFENNATYSVDNYIAVLMGLSLANKLLDGNINSFLDQNGHPQNFGSYYGDLHTMAFELGKQIITYLSDSYTPTNLSSDLIMLDGYALHGSNGSDGPYLIPLMQLAPQFGIPSSNFAFYGAVTPSATFWPHYTLCNAIFSLDPSVSINWTNFTASVTICPTNPSIQNVEEALEMSALSNLGGAYPSAKDMIYTMGQWGSFVGCSPCFVTLPPNNYGWNLFYMAVNQILFPSYNNITSLNLCDFESILNSAPVDGPFCHSIGFTGDLAPGWATDRRFLADPPSQDFGSVGGIGNFNGLDYMLFYNLYCLTQQIDNNLTKTVINDASNSTLHNISGNPGIPDYYPFDYIGEYIEPSDSWNYVIGEEAYGYLGKPFYVSTCSPIVVNKLTVRSPVNLLTGDSVDAESGQKVGTPKYIYNLSGDLVLQGGEDSYIDMVPTDGSIDIEQGAFFKASCTINCCETNLNSYSSAITIPYTVKTKQTAGNTDSTNSALPPYQPSPQFITLPTYDAILNYPNPFTNNTTFEFAVKETTPVSIAIYDTHGEKLADIIMNKLYNQGSYALTFDGTALSSGSYVCTMTTKDDQKSVEIIKD